jgi:hypothetical protein
MVVVVVLRRRGVPGEERFGFIVELLRSAPHKHPLQHSFPPSSPPTACLSPSCSSHLGLSFTTMLWCRQGDDDDSVIATSVSPLVF